MDYMNDVLNGIQNSATQSITDSPTKPSAGNNWLKIEFLQEDSYFPKTRGLIKIKFSSKSEAFVTDYNLQRLLISMVTL